VRQLAKTYAGGVQAVRGVDFTVRPGEVFGLLGPNGAGKSTIIGMLTTTVAPTSGTARVLGLDVARHPRQARRASAVVFQDSVVDRTLTGRANLEIHGRLWGLDRRAARRAVADTAARFGLADLLDRPAGTYSGGQRRRLEIARSLVSRPRLLFLDEPTVGLDPRVRLELLDVIEGARELTDMTIVVTTHYLDEAERLCDRVAIVHAGRIAALDTPAALLATLGLQVIEVRLATADASSALAALRSRRIDVDDAITVGSTLTIPLRDRSPRAARAVEDAIAELGIATAVARRAPTLDDVYLRLTGDRLAAAA
jgi:ABC-2 type transport system ATP-binding protein